MKLSQDHSLGKAEARRRVEQLIEHWQHKYGIRVDWTGDSAHLKGLVKGIDFDATLSIEENRIYAEGTDPGLLLRAAATAYLKKKLVAYLDASKSLDQVKELA